MSAVGVNREKKVHGAMVKKHCQARETLMTTS